MIPTDDARASMNEDPSRAGSAPWVEDRELLRAIHGQLSKEEERSFQQRLAADSRLEARHEHLRVAWQSLELPPAELGESTRGEVLARLAAEEGGSFARGEAPSSMASARMRLAAAVALVLGLLIGLGLGSPPMGDVDPQGASLAVGDLSPDELSPEELEAEDLAWAMGEGTSLAEAYWQALADTGGRLIGPEDSAMEPGREEL